MIINENEIHIYTTVTELDEDTIISYENILSADEIIKADRYKFRYLRDNYISCRGFLRNVLSGYTGKDPSDIIFSYSEFGKPYLNQSNIKFNVSHSGKLGLIAVDLNDELGIDIEMKRNIPDIYAISERYFSHDEISELRKTCENELTNSFLRCWTRKESFLKALGCGLQYPLKNFTVTVKADEEPVIREILNDTEEAVNWKLYNLNTEKNYFASLSVRNLQKIIVFKNHKQ